MMPARAGATLSRSAAQKRDECTVTIVFGTGPNGTVRELPARKRADNHSGQEHA